MPVDIDPGVTTGIVVIADGKVIETGKCFDTKELITSILKILRNVNFEVTSDSVKIGRVVLFCTEMLEDLESDLPLEVALDVVGEAGTNKPLKENRRSRRVRNIPLALRIAGRSEKIISRRNIVAAHSRIK